MANQRKGGSDKGSIPNEMGDLSKRLDDLKGRIASEEKQRSENQKQPASYGDATGYAKGYRLVDEFVAGTLVGGLIGYVLDTYVFGTKAVFLIIFLLLGFGAGILNMARAAKTVPPAQERLGSNPPPQAAFDDEEED